MDHPKSPPFRSATYSANPHPSSSGRVNSPQFAERRTQELNSQVAPLTEASKPGTAGESSVLFSLGELMSLERERVSAEARENEARIYRETVAKAARKDALRDAQEALMRVQEARVAEVDRAAREASARHAAREAAEVLGAQLAEARARESTRENQAFAERRAELERDAAKKRRSLKVVAGFGALLVVSAVAVPAALYRMHAQDARIANQDRIAELKHHDDAIARANHEIAQHKIVEAKLRQDVEETKRQATQGTPAPVARAVLPAPHIQLPKIHATGVVAAHRCQKGDPTCSDLPQ